MNSYRQLNSMVNLCFLDASKAFDRVNHGVLFDRLKERGVPVSIVKLLSNWYSKQKMCVRWGSTCSEVFTVTNGVRQGGILSPYLFNVYMDELSVKLNRCVTGCCLNGKTVNHLMYADDLVLISPSSRGLQGLLDVCSEFGVSHDVKYNGLKSAVMCCKSQLLKDVQVPTFTIGSTPVAFTDKIKYLGHIITEDLADDDDIERQNRVLFRQGNVLLRKFHMCSTNVKLTLFRTHCSSMYCAHLCWNLKEGDNEEVCH